MSHAKSFLRLAAFSLAFPALVACGSSDPVTGEHDGGAGGGGEKDAGSVDAGFTVPVLDPLAHPNQWRLVRYSETGVVTSDTLLTKLDTATGYSYFEQFTTAKDHTVSALFGNSQLLVSFKAGTKPTAGKTAPTSYDDAISVGYFLSAAPFYVVGEVTIDAVDTAKGTIAGRAYGASDGAPGSVSMSFNLALPLAAEQ